MQSNRRLACLKWVTRTKKTLPPAYMEKEVNETLSTVLITISPSLVVSEVKAYGFCLALCQ